MPIMKKWEAIQQEAKVLYQKTRTDVKRAAKTEAGDSFVDKVYGKLIDDLVLEAVAQYHRAAVKGYVDLAFPHHEAAIANGGDSQVEKRYDEFDCPNCNQLCGPEKFPKHLSGCMKLRRSSTRLSTGRVTPISMKETSDACPSTGTSDDGDYDDWWASPTSQPKKKKITQKSKNHKKVRFIVYFVVSFTAPPAKVITIENECNRDVDVIRKRVYKAVEPDTHDCTLEEEMKPAPYRLEVAEMIEEARNRDTKKPKFKFNTGLDYYPFQR